MSKGFQHLEQKKVLVKFLNTDCTGMFLVNGDKASIQLEIPLTVTSVGLKRFELSEEEIDSIKQIEGNHPYTITINKQLVWSDNGGDNQK